MNNLLKRYDEFVNEGSTLKVDKPKTATKIKGLIKELKGYIDSQTVQILASYDLSLDGRYMETIIDYYLQGAELEDLKEMFYCIYVFDYFLLLKKPTKLEDDYVEMKKYYDNNLSTLTLKRGGTFRYANYLNREATMRLDVTTTSRGYSISNPGTVKELTNENGRPVIHFTIWNIEEAIDKLYATGWKLEVFDRDDALRYAYNQMTNLSELKDAKKAAKYAERRRELIAKRGWAGQKFQYEKGSWSR